MEELAGHLQGHCVKSLSSLVLQDLGQGGVKLGCWASPSGACYWDSSLKRSSAKKRNAGSTPKSDVEGPRARCVMSGSQTGKGRTDGKQGEQSRGGRRQVNLSSWTHSICHGILLAWKLVISLDQVGIFIIRDARLTDSRFKRRLDF